MNIGKNLRNDKSIWLPCKKFKDNKEIIGYLESLEKMFNFEHKQALTKSTSCGDKLDDDDLDDY